MQYSTTIAVAIMLSLACNGCAARQSNTLEMSFRLTNQTTAEPLTNVVVSVYDGFDKTFRAFPRPVNEPYHFADITTSANGILSLDLSQFKEDEVLIKAGKLYKYIPHKGNIVKVIHYIREGNSLRVSAHYDYDLKTKLVSVTRIPTNQQVKAFTSPESRLKKVESFLIIDVPMD